MPPVYKRGLGCRLKQNYDPQMFKTALPGPSNPGNEISENSFRENITSIQDLNVNDFVEVKFNTNKSSLDKF